MYMINELVREIVGCLKSGYYMAALTTALTLPDICGKAESPELEKKTKLRYINWYNKYIMSKEGLRLILELLMWLFLFVMVRFSIENSHRAI